MKRIFLLILLVCPLMLAAQDVPEWIVKTPTPSNNTYEYKVEKGYGSTEQEARNQAYGRIFQGISFYLGAKASSADINKAVQNGQSFDVIAEYFDIPINKVCEKTIRNEEGYIVYLLCQVAKAGNREPKFDHFADCNKMAKNPYVGYAFVPGMAQIKKGSTAKGVCFIAGEVVFAGGIVVSECMRQSYINKINSTHNAQLRMQYTNNANICGIARNVSIAGFAAVYVWNVIDGIVAKSPLQYAWGETEMRFAPYADFESAGLALNVQF